ncbi:MAG: biopolymer transporter ExbD [Verrucomicrobiae bacterium]|nr:biopolymer transporter ExbD [Verrucomicrobiae bacterium]
MARRRSSKPFADEEPEMNISPLIDVAFLLLIYFIVTTTLMKQEADLGLVLPGVATEQSDPVKTDQMLIKITGEGSVFVNEELVDSDPTDRTLPNLTDRLQRYAAAAANAGSEAMVVVNCADEVPEQRFIDVLNACSSNGLGNISLTQ